MNIKSELQQLCGDTQNLRLNDVNIEPETIQAIMINEVVPSCPEDDFYGKPDSAYMSTTIPMFRKAGIEIGSVQDILNNGIYITNAVKTPKTEYAVSKESIEDTCPIWKKSLLCFQTPRLSCLWGMWQRKPLI